MDQAVIKAHVGSRIWCKYSQAYIENDDEEISITIEFKIMKMYMGFAKLVATVFNDYGEIEFRDFRFEAHDNVTYIA